MKEKWNNVIAPGLIIAGAVAVFIALTIFMINDQPVGAEQTPFDHASCQYPYRLSNPVDGCDNSDPACPAEIKAGICPATPDQDPIFPKMDAPTASQEVVSAPTPVKKGCFE